LHAVFPDNYFRFAWVARRLHGRQSPVRSRWPTILEQRVANSCFPRCFHGVSEAGSFRIHYCEHRVLLRHLDSGRNAGRGSVNNAGSGHFVGLDSSCRFFRHQIDFCTLGLPVDMSPSILPFENSTAAQTNAPTDAIVFDNVSIAFEENVVLSGVSFHLPLGETKAVFGVAGSGKSTILKLTLGLLPPDSGRIFLLGEEVTSMSEQALFDLRRRV